MPLPTESAGELSVSRTAQSLYESPFLDGASLAGTETESAEEEQVPLTSLQLESPFSTVYTLEGQEEVMNPEAEEFAEFLAELYDEEFDEALLQVANEAATFYQEQMQDGLGSIVAQEAEAEHVLEAHLAPLVQAAETMLENMAQGVEQSDLEAMQEAEFDALLDHYASSESRLSPAFENFLGKLWKKAKKAAKRGFRAVKRGVKKFGRLALRSILRKLKRAARSLLKRVLRYAINKLPRKYRGIAEQLRRKFLKEAEEEALLVEEEDELFQNFARMQHEFDLQIANLYITPEDTEQDVAIAAYVAESEEPTEDPIGELDRARAQFIRELGKLQEDEDPEPLVENFAPAILTAARLAIKFIGRPKVVRLLSKVIARLIRRFVGRRNAVPLSRVLVDAGLRLVNLEVTPQEELEAAHSSVASIVEDTVRRVGKLPPYILENDELLDGYVLEAFEQAAAAHLPHVLPERVYAQRPNLRETARVNGAWVLHPLRGKKYYKKYTRIIDTTLTPHVAQAVKAWGGIPLGTMLRDQLGLSIGRGFKARVHLYEAIPGYPLPHICQHERHAPDIGRGGETAWSHMLPLTPEAAGLLLGEPRLGRHTAPRYLVNSRMIDTNGQRFYYLEIADTPPQQMIRPDGPSRSTNVRLTMHFPLDQLELLLFLSEADAQEIAIKLRQQASLGAVVHRMMSFLETSLRQVLIPGMSYGVTIVHPRILPGQSSSMALSRLAPVVQEQLLAKVLEWAGRALIEHVKNRPQDILAAIEDPAYGVTFAMTMRNPPGFSIIRKILQGDTVSLRGSLFSDGIPDVRMRMVSGWMEV